MANRHKYCTSAVTDPKRKATSRREWNAQNASFPIRAVFCSAKRNGRRFSGGTFLRSLFLSFLKRWIEKSNKKSADHSLQTPATSRWHIYQVCSRFRFTGPGIILTSDSIWEVSMLWPINGNDFGSNTENCVKIRQDIVWPENIWREQHMYETLALKCFTGFLFRQRSDLAWKPEPFNTIRENVINISDMASFRMNVVSEDDIFRLDITFKRKCKDFIWKRCSYRNASCLSYIFYFYSKVQKAFIIFDMII